MQGEFDTAYKQLNPAQRQAVDNIDGPVLVVAGPGTGKTQLLSLRVANILLKTDTDANNILCLTFTNKAATNMRERLNQLIGPTSRNVAVRTFHSFAADIMNQYPDYFWEGARLSVAPDAVQVEIIQNILAKLPLSNPLSSTFAGAYTAIGDTKQALKLAKEAGLTPDELREIIGLNLAYIDEIEPKLVDLLSPALSINKLPELVTSVSKLPTQQALDGGLLLPLDTVIKDSLELAIEQDIELKKTTNTGKWKKRWVQTVSDHRAMHHERKRNNWWIALADVYEKYRKELHGRGYYDYSDMMIEVLEQLQIASDMKADIQERFPYVLIDEFQDTNAAQLRLAHLVADHYSANNRPNLMVVGDDDQSIFAFNGAELNNMLGFQRSYPDTKLVVLKENYRSTQSILNSAGQIIKQAEDRLTNREASISKELSATKIGDKKSNIQQFSYPTKQHQYTALAKRIKKLWASGKTDIAVLARNHSSLEQLAGILTNYDIPINYERRNDVLEHTAVRQIILVSELAVSIAEGNKAKVNVNLAEILRHPMWGISPKTLWGLAESNYSSPDWLDSLLSSENPDLSKIGNWLVWLSRVSNQLPLPRVIDYILGIEESEYLLSPYREFFLDKQPLSPEYLESLSAINSLRELTREFANKQSTLSDFVRFVELNRTSGTTIADESWFISGRQAVKLLTVYKAKGLEFDHVFLVDAIESTWRPRTGGRTSPANLQLQSYGEKYDDYIRLLYVSITRARYDFIATSYFEDEKGNEILPTPLLSSIPLKRVTDPNDNPIEVLENGLRWPRLNKKDERALLAHRLENYSISQSAFIDFLNVAESGPGSFMERHLLHIPKVHSAIGSYGTAIHAALETAQRLVNISKIDLGTVLDRFEASLGDQHLSPIDFERYKIRGEELLTELIAENKVSLVKGGKSEQVFSDVLIGKANINGKLDRIDLDDSRLIISDYKTGKSLNSFDTKDKTKQLKAWRHRNQLLFYSLLVEQSGRFKSKQVSGQMIYVEAEKPNELVLSLSPTKNDLTRLQALIQIVWKHVMDLDFPDTDGYSPDISGVRKFEEDLINGTI